MRPLVPFRGGWDLADRIFGDFSDAFFGRDVDAYDKNLRVHTQEEEDKFVVMAEVPGLKEDQLNIEYKDGVLTVSANYEEKEEGKDFASLRRGRYSWSCTARNIDHDKIEANLTNGILKIDLPKSPEAQPKKISISKS